MEVKSVILKRREGKKRYAPAALFIENGTGIRVLRWQEGMETRHLSRNEVARVLVPLIEIISEAKRPILTKYGNNRGWKLEIRYADGTGHRSDVDGQFSKVWSCLAREMF
ncbi:MAG: hypothetical protein ACOX17_07360 [Christensenellales bacterium]|jgi:hypothetical protein